jgi:outer membrane lipoprotein carrier protein
MHKLLILLFLLPGLAAAAATDELKTFLGQTQTLKARFAQMVLDRNLKPLQQAQGNMQFSRPGKFRWDYQKPYEQTIVGDGTRLWIHDKDLNQVTVRKLDRALGASPAALLAGGNDLERDFTLSNTGMKDGLDWLDAVPKSRDTVFERVRMGFGKAGLEAMELRDQFGQVTVITFADVERNPRIPADVFRFTPPQGADVITE